MRPAMIKYLQVVKDEAGTLDEFHLSQVPSSENNQADALSKLSSSASCDAPRSVFWEVMEKRSIEHNPIEILHQSSTWMDGIRAYLADDTLPDAYLEAVALKKWAVSFETHNGALFKKGYLQPLLKCITP